MRFKTTLLAIPFLGLATAASAATISLSTFDVTSYNTAVAAGGPAVTEDFESALRGNVANGFSTAVGTFATLGGTGSGGTVTRSNFINDGNLLAVRDSDVFGRTSTTALLQNNTGLNQYLDSNDTFGISWMVDLGGQMFNRLVLTLTDAADVGAELEISTNGSSSTLVSEANGNQQLVVIDFASALSTATINFANLTNGGMRTNDGFSLDDIVVSTVPASVPLPAGVLLMGTALGGLGLMRRRRKHG